MSDLKIKLLELVQRASNSEHVLQSEIDAIIMITGAMSQDLPELFVTIVGRIERDFPEIEEWMLQESLERLISICETAKMISELGSTEVNNEALLPMFELQTDDKNRVILLCAQMRKIVFASEIFDQPHRRRLLDRIAAIEKQIEQPKGMLDVICGGVSDIGETLGKFGVDIKPLSDRMGEVMQITRAGSKEYEQLPAPEEVKRLPKPTKEEKADGK